MVVNLATGQLGFAGSSERKADITPIASGTERLSQPRPVRFHLKTDPNGSIQYGLVAEEVDKVYPELVIRDNNGKIQGVRYDELAPMLLNEMQRDNQRALTQDATIAAQATKIALLEQQLAGIQASLVNLQPKDEFVSRR